MSISTKRGDDGETDLLFGRRVPKTHPRVIACGAIDELTASLGMARATTKSDLVQERIASIQDTLIILMGEVMTESEDLPRFQEAGFQTITEAMADQLTEWVRELEEDHAINFKQWAIPGKAGNSAGAALDIARTICRRAEREVLKLVQSGQILNPAIQHYLNRLSDVCWLLARFEEQQQ